MKAKNIFVIAFLLGIALWQGARAGEAEVRYPVTELGGCASKSSCQAYCDKPANTEACVAFAESHGLISGEELQKAKKFIEGGMQGPGGCDSQASCENYCNDTSNIDECISYAEKEGIMPPDELAEAKKVQAAIKRGIEPPPCGGKKACDAYCQDPSNMKVCVAFAEQAGFLSGQELAEAKKMIAAIEKGATPPSCKGKEECDAYCSEPQNAEVCINFALAAGMMNEEEAAMAKKTGGRGPGGCKGREECDVFCKNPANQQTCFEFGRDNGLIPAEELQKMEEGNKMFFESLNNAPTEVKACMEQAFGDLSKIFPSRETGDKMGECFGQFGGGAPGQGPAGQMGPQTGPSSFPGPGGCNSPEECQAYCSSHMEECQSFGPGPEAGAMQGPGPGPMPTDQKMTGPGGCQSPEECDAYCQAHPQECGAPGPNSGPGPGPMPEGGAQMPPPEFQSGPAPAPAETSAPQSLLFIFKSAANVFFALNPLLNISK